ncbi:MAG: response regulator [Bacilli bacterium]|nr:response regulator [Bacilli bacterium]
MTGEYKGILDKAILDSYIGALVIDVQSDKLYKYNNINETFNLEKEESYVDYITNCNAFIHPDDIQEYISSLSISKLESNGYKINLSYRMLDERLGTYLGYMNNITLYDENGKKIIVVLIANSGGELVNTGSNPSKSEIEEKYSKTIDAISLALLKIHNVVNMDNELRTKDEYINSILVGLTTDYPDLNKSFNENALEVYKSGKTNIMIVDDDKITCNLISKIFDNKYDIIIANNGQEAIDKLKQCKDNSISISCIFLDLLMPVLDGFGVLDYLSDNNYLNKIPVIIISGNYDKDTRKRVYSYPIADMLEKPFNAQVIRHRIENLINLYRSSGNLNEMMLEQHESLKDIILALVAAYKADNSVNMNIIKKYVNLLAMQVSVMYPEYNVNSNMVEKMANSSMYYSIGNYTLPKSLLAKKSEYTEEEKASIKYANVNGSAMVKYVISNTNSDVDSKYCYEITRYYNERYDGTGYPEGLSGESIPLSAQIASLAIEYVNLVNSMTPVDYSKVAALITMEAGRKFNPKIVEAFKKVQTDFETITKVGG